MKFKDVTGISDDQAREYLEFIRWPNGPVCPHCKSLEVTKLQGKSTRPGVYKCKSKECRKQFTVTVGTIFERSHVALRYWVMAFHLMCASKKGISAHQLHRMLGITYKTAWFVCHRVRYAMKEGFTAKLDGVVEADETFVGPKVRGCGKGMSGKASPKKTPVVALVERGGNVRAVVMPRVTAATLRTYLKKNIDPAATLMTDQCRLYQRTGREFARHGVSNHSRKEYKVGDVSTNTVEGFFGLLKRGVNGTFHHINPKHLQRYVDEFEFRYNRRKVDDSTRTISALQGVEGKRLMYR